VFDVVLIGVLLSAELNLSVVVRFTPESGA
jgi:hypothetical protein